VIQPRKDKLGWADAVLQAEAAPARRMGLAREATPGSESGASARGLPRNLGDPMHCVNESRRVRPAGVPNGLACGEQRVATVGANNDARHGTGGEG